MVETGQTPLLTPEELGHLGFQLVVSPVTAMFAAVHAVQQALATLHDRGSLRDHLDGLVAFEDFTDLVGLATIAEHGRPLPDVDLGRRLMHTR